MKQKLIIHNIKLNKLLKKARNDKEKSLIKSKILLNNEILLRLERGE